MSGFAMNERFRLAVPPAFWLILVLFAGCPAAAQGVDPFTITDVAVDATAATAVEARNRAMADGQRAAYQRLLRRLTPESEWSRLPPAGGTALDALVRGFQVAGERSSATRYLARLTVTFHRDPVRQLLREAGIPFTETAARPALLLPVYRDAGGTLLWEDNPWRQAWIDRPERDSLAPLLLPRRDQAVPDDFSPMVATSGDEGQMRRLATRLGAGSVVVAEARPAAGGVTVSVTRYGADGGGRPESGSFASLAEAAQRLAAGWDEDWKARTLLRFDSRGLLLVQVPYATIESWVAVRRKLGETSEITRIEIASLTNREALLTLSHIGDVQTLKLALRQRDLILQETVAGWIIEPAGGRSPR